MDGFAFLLLISAGAALIWIYFLPSLKAINLGHPDQNAIFILNLLLGWMIIPWVLALVWAYKSFTVPNSGAPDNSDEVDDGTKKCPFCAETVKVEAIKCRHCGSDIPHDQSSWQLLD